MSMTGLDTCGRAADKKAFQPLMLETVYHFPINFPSTVTCYVTGVKTHSHLTNEKSVRAFLQPMSYYINYSPWFRSYPIYGGIDSEPAANTNSEHLTTKT